MIKALTTSATGMSAQETKLNQISNDLANMGTTGYKKGRTDFQDLYYQTIKEAGGNGASQTPVGVQVGSGSKVAAQYSVFEQGPIKITNNMFDLAVNGDGFFEVDVGDGTTAFTRDGAFKLNSEGTVVTSSGRPIIPNVQVPPGSFGITITENGTIRVKTNEGENDIGRIQLASFVNTSGLSKLGGNMVKPTTASGPPLRGNPGEGGMGGLQQGALEGSTVNPTESVMDMITTQRMYESNARIMGVSDQMWATTNNIGNR